ncbi:NADP-dependent oxidoreductase [Pseudomonas putida]
MTQTQINRQWLLAQRPVGAVHPSDFRYHEGAVPVAQPGDVLVRCLYFGYDASQRIWLTEEGGYLPPIYPGDPMRSIGLGKVIESRHPDFAPGDLVEGLLSWQDYAIVRADGVVPLRKLPSGDYPLSWNLGVFGVGGLTAYFGLADGLNIKVGDTVVVSAASGSIGSLAAGVAKALGAKRVIGIAGGTKKCQWIVDHAGYDVAIDYQGENLDERLRAVCPEGVDAYFDNVGGDMLDTLLMHMAPHGRVLICGALSTGYTEMVTEGPRNFMRVLTHNLTIQGILLSFYRDRMAQGASQMAQWVAEGRLHVEECLVEGFEKAPELLPTIFGGKSPGKLVLKVSELSS